MSYGLSKILGEKHCYANCIAFQHLADFYPQGVREFDEMTRKYNIQLPKGLSKKWSDETITSMAQVAIKLEHMWNHAIGLDWKSKVTLDTVKDLFRRL